jgi:hypothetical protein
MMRRKVGDLEEESGEGVAVSSGSKEVDSGL